MAKQTDVRPKITLACVECKERNYITKKNRRNDPDRLELSKFCPRCRNTPDNGKPRGRIARPVRNRGFRPRPSQARPRGCAPCGFAAVRHAAATQSRLTEL